MRSFVGGVIASSLVALASTSFARAQIEPPCAVAGRTAVRLADEAINVDKGAFRARLRAQLEVGLAGRHIALCFDADGEVASDVTLSGDAETTLTLNVRDDVTGKQLSRALELRSVPVDARPLTVALAIDELLRASWVELTLADAPRPPRPVPPEVVDALGPAPGHTRWELGAALAAEAFRGGTREAGVDVVGRVFPRGALAVTAALGVRRLATVNAVDGDVRGRALDASLGLDVPLRSRARRIGIDFVANAWLARVRLSGAPRGGARGADVVATAAVLDAGVRGDVGLSRAFALSLTGTVGLPVHAVEIFDGAHTIAGLSGPLVSLSLAGWWRFGEPIPAPAVPTPR